MLSGRISVAAFSAVAAAAFMFSAGSAEAGPADLAAIKNDLLKQSPPLVISGKKKPGQQDATYADIMASVQRVIDAQLQVGVKKPLQIGNIIGEAMKTPQVTATPEDAGAELAQIAIAAIGATPTADVVQKLVAFAAKTSATSKGANVLHVPSFAAAILGDDASNTDTLAAALLASTSKTAVAAILEGRATGLGSDADKTALVTAAIGDKKLVNSVAEISKAIAGQIGDSAAFAENVGVKLVEVKKTSSILKVVPGIVAANAEDAGDITAELLRIDDSANLAEVTLKSTVVKGISSYAKAVAAVADIEQISVVGSRLAQELGANSAGAKVGVAAGLAKTLALAIFSKPTPEQAGASYDLTDAQGALTIANRTDEIAEVAAYVAGGILGNTSLAAKNYKTLNATVMGIIKGAIAGSVNKKAKEVTAAFATDPGKALKEKMIVDIAASVSLTVKSYLDTLDAAVSAPLITALEKYLTSTASLKALAGKSLTLKEDVTNAIKVALGTQADTDGILAKLENGYTGRNDLASLVDPETDNKNF